MDFTPAELRVLTSLDEQKLVDDVRGLIRLPSNTGSAAESDAQHQQAAALSAVGMDVDLWSIDVATIRAHPDFPADETDRWEAFGVVAATGRGLSDSTQPALVLQGHVDVVPVGDPLKWPDSPFGAEVRGGTESGRGACDMKAGVAVHLAVARAIHLSGVHLTRLLAVHTV